jgi:hypothetical protein
VAATDPTDPDPDARAIADDRLRDALVESSSSWDG